MDVVRNFLFCGENITVHYNSSDRMMDEKGIIEVFPFYKISVMLTDGLEARFTSGISHTLKAGQIIIFSPYQAHYGRFLRNGHFEYMEFYVPVELIEKKKALKIPAESVTVDGENLLEIIYNFADACISGDEIKLPAYFVVFCDFLEKLCISRSTGEKIKTPPILKQAIEYISRDFVNIKGVGEIAKKCACSEKHVTSLFKKQMGITAYEYLVKTKLNNAKGILLSGGSVTSACFDSGFSDYSHFIQVFKRNYGITPNKFKNR